MEKVIYLSVIAFILAMFVWSSYSNLAKEDGNKVVGVISVGLSILVLISFMACCFI